MPRFRCPRCSTVVTAAAGVAPLCPACGFGSGAAAPPLAAAPAVVPAPVGALPPMPQPAQPAPAPTVLAAPAPRRGNGRKVAALVVAGVVVLAGLAAAAWFLLGFGGVGPGGGSGSDLSQAEAEERLAASLASANGALTGGDAPDGLREVAMTMQSPPGSPGAAEDLFAPGDLEMTITYGRGDVVRMHVLVESGPATIEMTLICSPTQVFLLYGGDAYGSRESVEEADAECYEGGGLFGPAGGPLGDEVPDGEVGGMVPIPTLDDLEAEDADITVHRDGSITAVVEDEESRATLALDDRGRIVRIVVDGKGESAGMEAVMDFVYGSRSTIDLPDDYELLPASVATDRVDDGAVSTWTVTESPHEPRVDELEVRIQEWGSGFGLSDDGDGPPPLATFGLVAGEQRQGNFTFRFTDADGDGRLTTGDSYVLTDLDAQAQEADEEDGGFGFGLAFPQHDAVLYDREADGAVNSGPAALMPSPLWLVVAALAGAAVAMRRLR